MPNVLILSLVFPPDSVSTAQIMGEIAKDLESQGHKVTVITTFPHYNRDSEAESRQPIRNYWGPVLRKSDYCGISVYHTLMPKKGKNVLIRLLAWGGFHQVSIMAGMAIVPRPDVILAPSPPSRSGYVAGSWENTTVFPLSTTSKKSIQISLFGWAPFAING